MSELEQLTDSYRKATADFAGAKAHLEQLRAELGAASDLAMSASLTVDKCAELLLQFVAKPLT